MSHKVGGAVELPAFHMTPLDDVPGIASTIRETFKTNKTKDVQYRLTQLRKLWWALKDYTPQLEASLMHDLRKVHHDAHMSEIDWCLQDCMFAIRNLEKWVKDDTKLDYPITFAALKPRIRKEPYGPVLIIGTYNFPVNLAISPLTGAIAAGCTAVLKPSEHAPATAAVLVEMLSKYLDPSAYRVVNGAVPETTALLNEKWAKIFYTGGEHVAKIISKKAAETLTPVCLELGGRNPAFVSKNADLALAARRLMWGKTINAGQVCLSHNYVIVDRAVVQDFIKCLQATYNEFFPQGAKASPDFARVINHNHFDRMKKMLDSTSGKIVMGGEVDRGELFIAPTAVLVEDPQDSMIQQESFGPIWSIVPYDSLDGAIKMVNSVDPTPLALFTFGSKEENEKILGSVTSGGATMNDSFTHASLPTVPFGGVGTSGTGAYRGKASFDCFTHNRAIAEVPKWIDGLLRVRYIPYDTAALKRFQWMNLTKPNFDRNGKKIQGFGYWLWLIFGLGGPSAKGALFRWALVLSASYVYVNGLDTSRLPFELPFELPFRSNKA